MIILWCEVVDFKDDFIGGNYVRILLWCFVLKLSCIGMIHVMI
jgi:hypothetical protein